MERSGVAVIIPCFNEGKTISDVVVGARKFADVFVIDDGSTDRSADIARQAGAEIIQTGGRLGYEAVIDHGLRAAHSRGFAWIMTLDGDGEHDPECIGRMLERARTASVDVVFGRRLAYARFGETVVGRIAQLLIGVSDPLCGAKLFSYAVIDQYAQQGKFSQSNLVHTRHAFDAVANGMVFSEVDVFGVIRTDQSRYGRAISANLRILRLAPYVILAALHRRRAKRR